MRKIVLFCFVLLLAACGKEQVKITGHISNAGKAVMYLDEIDVYDIIPADSVALKKNGRFSFSFDSKVPCFYQLRLSPDKVIILFPKPGQHIKITADANNLLASLAIEGSHDTEQITKIIRLLDQTKVRLDSITTLSKSITQDSILIRLNKEYLDILERHRKVSIAYLLTHSNSLSSLYVLYQQYQPNSYVFYKTTDIQFFKIVSDTLTKYYPGLKHVTALQAYTNNLIGKYKSQVLYQQALQGGVSLPVVALPDMAGDTITLKSLKGKYVLLSFWSSENKSCVSQNLELKKVYEKYKSRNFEILQVAFDNSKEAWGRAVRFDELPWKSVIDEGFQNSPIAGNYNITQLPANYLIDKDNVTILGKNLTPYQLQTKLQDLYN
jgi:peroxiredoxin